MKSPRFFFIFMLLFYSPLGFAEYRVFLLKISQPSVAPGQPEMSRWVESNLDPEQYRKYYPVYPKEKISYVDTWRCYGRTEGFQAFCKSPRAPAESPENPPPQDQISNPVR